MGADVIRSASDIELPHQTQSRSEDYMTVSPPTGARSATPASQNPSNTTQPAKYTAVRTDQVADLQVIEKKVDAYGLPVLGHQPGLSTRFVGKTGSQILIQMLAEHGVTDAFGYPGGAILPTFDALYDAKI